MRRWRSSYLLVLVAAALLLSAAKSAESAASQNHRRNQHQAKTQQTKSIQEQQPQVPLSVWETTQATFSEALRAQKEQSIAEQKQADAYKETWGSPSVIVNIVLAVAGLGYLIFARLQWLAIKDQAKTAAKTLLLQFRPKLIVRNVIVRPSLAGLGDKSPDYFFVRNELVMGQFFVANVGDSPATITESFCNVYWMNNPLPMRRPYEGQDGNNPVLGRIEAGGRKTGSFASSEAISVNHTEIGLMGYPDFKPVWSVYVMGWIEYADDLGFQRRTSFCRKFDPAVNRFVAVKDSDYEIVE